MAERPLAQRAIQEAKSDHGAAPFAVYLLFNALKVISVSAFQDDAGSLLQTFTVANGAVLGTGLNCFSGLGSFGNAIFMHTWWMAVELVIKIAPTAKVSAWKRSRARDRTTPGAVLGGAAILQRRSPALRRGLIRLCMQLNTAE